MKRMLLLILPIVFLGMPMSARGDTQPATAQTAQTASAYVASDVGMQKTQVAITKLIRSVDVAIVITIKPLRVAMKMVGKPMDVALMIVKPAELALQIMKQALILFDHPMRLAQASEADIICEM